MRHRTDVVGALNQDAIRLGQVMADVATIGMLQAPAIRQRDALAGQLPTALSSRIFIGQAKGVIAERRHLDMDQSFTLLRGTGRPSNRRLSELARAVVDGSEASASAEVTGAGRREAGDQGSRGSPRVATSSTRSNFRGANAKPTSSHEQGSSPARPHTADTPSPLRPPCNGVAFAYRIGFCADAPVSVRADILSPPGPRGHDQRLPALQQRRRPCRHIAGVPVRGVGHQDHLCRAIYDHRDGQVPRLNR
jgi:hypothetical protein